MIPERPVRALCPGDPNGHHWQLHSEEPWRQYTPPQPIRWRWRIIGLLIPFFGWVALVAEHDTRAWAANQTVGVERRWFCQLCRRPEVTYHKY